MADFFEHFGNHATNKDYTIGSPAVYRPSRAIYTLAENKTETGIPSPEEIFAVLPPERTFQIDNPNGATVRIDASNDPTLGWNTNYISTTATTDFYETTSPWHYIRVVIESQSSPVSEVTVKMGV